VAAALDNVRKGEHLGAALLGGCSAGKIRSTFPAFLCVIKQVKVHACLACLVPFLPIWGTAGGEETHGDMYSKGMVSVMADAGVV
jgi:hypothetical protein